MYEYEEIFSELRKGHIIDVPFKKINRDVKLRNNRKVINLGQSPTEEFNYKIEELKNLPFEYINSSINTISGLSDYTTAISLINFKKSKLNIALILTSFSNDRDVSDFTQALGETSALLNATEDGLVQKMSSDFFNRFKINRNLILNKAQIQQFNKDGYENVAPRYRRELFKYRLNLLSSSFEAITSDDNLVKSFDKIKQTTIYPIKPSKNEPTLKYLNDLIL